MNQTPPETQHPNLKMCAEPLFYSLIGLTARTLHVTWRTEKYDPQNFLKKQTPWPVIFSCWHNRLLFAPLFFPPDVRRKTAGLASYSRDGEYAARLLQVYGMKAVRGSTSRGGYRALARLKQTIEAGNAVAITPDGPRGPRYEAQQGAVILAIKTGAPIVPISINAPRRWELKGWDKTQIPKPFSRVHLHIGEPAYFTEKDKEKDGRALRHSLQQQMMAITDDSPAPHT